MFFEYLGGYSLTAFYQDKKQNKFRCRPDFPPGRPCCHPRRQLKIIIDVALVQVNPAISPLNCYTF